MVLLRGGSNRIVAAYQLVATTGRLTAPNLALAVPQLRPDADHQKTRDRAYGLTVDTVDCSPAGQSTTTKTSISM